MKIGITYLYTILKYGYPPGFSDEIKALSEIADLGFHYLETEGLGAEHLLRVARHRSEYKKALDDLGMHIHNFCMVDRALVSTNIEHRKGAYERAKLAVELAKHFEAETFHLASYTPDNVSYTSGAPYTGSTYRLNRSYKLEIPPEFRWETHWLALVESTRYISDLAADAGLKVIMEPRVGETICSSDSLLRLIEQVDRPNFFANFDCAHFQAQREIIPLSLERLRGKYANVHIADNDIVTADHLPVGKGVIDWDAFFLGLKRHGYEGYLGIDLSTTNTIIDDLKYSRDFIMERCAAHSLPCEV